MGLTKKIDFLYFDICCSPIFLLSKMGSFVAVASILLILWAFFQDACREKLGKFHIKEKIDNFHLKNLSSHRKIEKILI